MAAWPAQVHTTLIAMGIGIGYLVVYFRVFSWGVAADAFYPMSPAGAWSLFAIGLAGQMLIYYLNRTERL